MRVIIIDSGSVTGKLLQYVFTESGATAILATSIPTAFDEVVDRGANAVLVNAEFNEMRGVDLCRDLRAESYNGPLLIWGERRKDEILLAYEFGVDDHIAEPFDPVEAVARVEAVIRRCKRLDDHTLGLLRVGDAELSIGKLTFQSAGREAVPLTPIEMRILEYLMRNSRIVISPEALLRWAWGSDVESDSNRVHVYMMRLRRKIEQDRSRPEYIHTVRGVGYTFRPPDPLPIPTAHMALESHP
ncbi:MAG: response regulator transcription factor [Nitrolancea sp.]